MNYILIPAHNPGPYTGSGNNTYLVVGREPALIDAGAGDPRHLDELDRVLKQEGHTLHRVLVTHGHSDHASGAEAIAARWPQTTFAKMPWPEYDERYPVRWTPIHDGQLLRAGDVKLRAIHTPGHAPDHLCFFEEQTGTLFAGDLVVRGTTVMIPGSRGGSVANYLESLKHVLALGPARLLPAHGPAVDDPVRLIHQYIAHRMRRDDQVIAALRSGRRTPDAIVPAVYESLAPDLVRGARESVLAHLIKLEAEGRVRRDEDNGWAIA